MGVSRIQRAGIAPAAARGVEQSPTSATPNDACHAAEISYSPQQQGFCAGHAAVAIASNLVEANSVVQVFQLLEWWHNLDRRVRRLRVIYESFLGVLRKVRLRGNLSKQCAAGACNRDATSAVGIVD